MNKFKTHWRLNLLSLDHNVVFQMHVYGWFSSSQIGLSRLASQIRTSIFHVLTHSKFKHIISTPLTTYGVAEHWEGNFTCLLILQRFIDYTVMKTFVKYCGKPMQNLEMQQQKHYIFFQKFINGQLSVFMVVRCGMNCKWVFFASCVVTYTTDLWARIAKTCNQIVMPFVFLRFLPASLFACDASDRRV